MKKFIYLCGKFQNTPRMKKVIFTIATSLFIMNAIAQPGCFIHKVYEPLVVELRMFTPFYFDITGDSIPEFCFEQSGVAIENSTLNGWECCTYNPDHPEISYTFQDLDITFDDDSMDWGTHFTPYMTSGSYNPAIYECKVAMRFRQGDDYYYGWWDGTVVWEQNSDPILFYRESCYCTVPNYPLHFGQTDFTWEVDENEATAFATIYPNPAAGQVTITGLNLKQAEVFNALGQRVTMVKGKDETLQIDMANLPTGVYFVNVTGEEGRKCVRKVVKE